MYSSLQLMALQMFYGFLSSLSFINTALAVPVNAILSTLHELCVILVTMSFTRASQIFSYPIVSTTRKLVQKSIVHFLILAD